ncbi:hypothetical protein K439DRAFT_1626122 [Ramaria rubella]|nr:hypothetical protein K439DRAFT_1626122 [Ramaria rubella]
MDTLGRLLKLRQDDPSSNCYHYHHLAPAPLIMHRLHAMFKLLQRLPTASIVS